MPEKPAEANKEWAPSFGGAVLRCSACKKKISKEAKSCPHCKAKLSEKPVSATVAFVPGDMAKAHEEDVAREKKDLPWFSIGLAALLMAVFALQLIPGFTLFFVLVPSYLASEPWTLLTNVFLHGDMTHIFFNLIGLWVFGVALEKVTRKSFMGLVFIASGIIGSIGAVLLTNDPSTGFLGASGGIFGFIGAVMILRSNMLVNLRGVHVPMKFVGPIYMLIELASFGAVDNIAHSAHIFGMLGGLALGLWWQRGGSRIGAPVFAACCILAVFASFAVAIPLGLMQPEGYTFEEQYANALATGNSDFCLEELKPEWHHECIMDMALLQNEPSYCDRLSLENRSNCRALVAVATNNISICPDGEIGDSCRTILEAPISVSDCNGENGCIMVVAILEGNASKCGTINDPETKDQCCMIAALSRRDPAACLLISDSGVRSGCEAALERFGNG